MTTVSQRQEPDPIPSIDRGLVRHAERFLDHLAVERGLAANTVTAYRRDLRLYLAELTGRGLTDPTHVGERDIAEFLAGLREREYAPGHRYSSDSPLSHRHHLADSIEVNNDRRCEHAINVRRRPLDVARIRVEGGQWAVVARVNDDQALVADG